MASSSSSSNKKPVVLISSDGETFEVEEEVAMQSSTIKHMIEDGSCVDTGIPLPNVTSKILSKVINYCKKHMNPSSSSEEVLKAFDEKFMKDVVDHKGTLFDLLMAANYLDIKGLLLLTGKATADMIKDMSCEEVRKTFNIKNDFAPGEEEATRQENPWAYVL